jgi:hypothetical protein
LGQALEMVGGAGKTARISSLPSHGLDHTLQCSDVHIGARSTGCLFTADAVMRVVR